MRPTENPFLIFLCTVFSVGIVALFAFNSYPIPITGAALSPTAIGFSLWGLPFLIVIGTVLFIVMKRKTSATEKPYKTNFESRGA